jgi:hypothetical protein
MEDKEEYLPTGVVPFHAQLPALFSQSFDWWSGNPTQLSRVEISSQKCNDCV